MEILVAAVSGGLIGLSFYLGSKIVNKYFKGLENSQWKNFVIAIIGFAIIILFSVLLLSILMKDA